jgi:hypothetical protein
MYRDKDLLELAKGEKCLLQAHPRCYGDHGETTVACHSNLLIHGKGKSLKAEDCYTVWGCYMCHKWLDTSQAGYEEKEKAFENAFVRQLHAWADIAYSPTMKPWKVEAARRVLAYLGDQHG